MRTCFKNCLSGLFFLLLVHGLRSTVHGPVLHAEVTEKVVAVVGDDVITLYDLDRAMAPLAKQKNAEGVRRQILENLVHQKLLEQEVAKAEIEVTDEDLQRAVAGILHNNGITIDILRSELSSKGITFEAYKDQIKEQIRQAKFIQQNLAPQVQVTAQDVQNFRRRHQLEDAAKQKVTLAWIFLPWEEEASDKAEREQVEEARGLAEKLRKGEDAEKIAKKHPRTERTLWTDELTPELREAASKMAAGEIGDPVTTPQGVYVMELKERHESGAAEGKAGNLSEEEVYQRLFNERLDQEIHNYVLRLRKKAFVEIRTAD
ncbi:MAG: SurA N-terminal domain-containing protein [Deltaproteobacteria bacterium]|nr:SurA N-terminal domain-containing protein [Deltaproteobacteria bacterium]